MEIYDKIGVDYNFTRRADPYLSDRLYQLLTPQKGRIYLDIGCGTGNYTIALHNRNVNFIGIDPSERMLAEAKTKCNTIQWQNGKAENIPLESNTMDGVMASLTLHHWTDLNTGLKELSRVLKSGSRLIIFTSTSEQMEGYWLNHYSPKMLQDSIDQMPNYQPILTALMQNGFQVINEEKYFIKEDLQDLFLYSGKYNPSLYFHNSVRQGISSFASLANAEEVELGLEKLKQDTESGEIENIISSYANDMGDYLFLVAQNG